MIPYKINGSFICERCRQICKGGCFERLMAIENGEVIEGSKEYEANKDLIGRKQIIRCLGKYCDNPCRFQLEEYTPYKEEDGIKPLINLINYMGGKVNELIAELSTNGK